MARDYSHQSGVGNRVNRLLSVLQERFMEGQSLTRAVAREDDAFCRELVLLINGHRQKNRALIPALFAEHYRGAGEATDVQACLSAVLSLSREDTALLISHLDRNGDGVFDLSDAEPVCVEA